jgi:DNA-binding beta-propeller fold protein YncE
MIQRILLALLIGATIVVFVLPGQKSSADRVTKGGAIMPVRSIVDPYPVFNGIAVDSDNNIVAMTDGNRKSLLIYDRTAGSADSEEETEPLRQMIGPETNIGFVAGIMIDPKKHEVFAVNNDIEDTMLVLPCESKGNVRPSRLLSVPHQAWGLAYSPARKEMAVSVEMHNGIVFYRLDANGVDAPLRAMQGPHTGLADPHGIAWDETHSEIAVANHGNFRGLAKNMGQGCTPSIPAAEDDAEVGQFQPPSITVYPATAKGDQKPSRTIQGPATQLDWPMGLAVDPVHNEIAVVNNGDNSVLFYRRTAAGDVAPVRAIRGPRTRISRPMGLAIDTKNDEVWVANFADHTALAFNRTDSGDQAPKRIIRNAPAGTPSAGFGNPMAMAYDSKREEILVPN